MGLYGALLKGTGRVVGVAGKIAVKGTCHLIGGIADTTGHPQAGTIARGIGNELGNTVEQVSEWTGTTAGKVIDTTLVVTAKVGGEVGAGIADIAGVPQHQIETYRKVGSILTSSTLGFFLGDVAGSVLTGVTTSLGIASTGTAISTLNGAAQNNAVLALIGGGAKSVGGGGILAGQAVLDGINITSAIGGGMQGNSVNKCIEENKSIV